MRLDMSMTREKDELHINSWWAGSPDFALRTLADQLEAAKVIWPELSKFRIERIEEPAVEPTVVAPDSKE